MSAGIMRSLNEKGAYVLPVLLEKCEVPLLLSDKRYADLTTDYNVGLIPANFVAPAFSQSA
jgi:hypothetical protein